MNRRAAATKIINQAGRHTGHRYQLRGPLTIAQVEKELFGRPFDPNYLTGTSRNPDFDRLWQQIRSDYRKGDELYFADSDKRSWRQLNGRRGYVLIRQNRIIYTITTFIN